MYQDSVKYDESNMVPLFGMIYCRIRQELYDDALQQLEFLHEITDSIGRTADLCFLEAILEYRKKGNRDGAIRLLDQSLNLHITSTKQVQSNIEFYIKLNADFLMELAKEYLAHCGAKPDPMQTS